MALDFKLKDVMHRITAKFFPAFLPDAKKPYNLRAVYQPELDIHGIASKAEVYNITTSPKVIEEGATALMELVYYLAADGYKISTPVFNLRVGIPGEYEGHETHLPPEVHPHGLINLSAGLRQYLQENVAIQLDGIESNEGFIGSFYDKDTDTTTTLTPGGLYILHGIGLKIASDAEHANDVGIYYEDASSGERIREDMKNIAQNEPATISALANRNLLTARHFYIVIRTQSPVNHVGRLLKNVREVKSDFTLWVS
jgi:hypothetical protein